MPSKQLEYAGRRSGPAAQKLQMDVGLHCAAPSNCARASRCMAEIVAPVVIRATLEAAGVEFTDGDAPGVRLRCVNYSFFRGNAE